MRLLRRMTPTSAARSIGRAAGAAYGFWWPIAQIALEDVVRSARIFASDRVVRRGGRSRRSSDAETGGCWLAFWDPLWPVVPLGGRLARVVRPLPCLQLVNGVADEVSNAEAEWAFATCSQLLKCGVPDAQVDCRLLTGDGARLVVGACLGGALGRARLSWRLGVGLQARTPAWIVAASATGYDARRTSQRSCALVPYRFKGHRPSPVAVPTQLSSRRLR
jgi:hypothetical protein